MQPRSIQLVPVAALAGAAACLLHLAAAPAADRVIHSVDPAGVMQGDTVLLTITGENLPTGTVVVEFFPQQVAVLKVLSATDREVIAQIKVPSMAPPGQYNIMVYNQLGDEAFAQGMLVIGSGLITPVFRDYDPKVIAEASSGFALMLTGDSITPAVVDHLSMDWQLGEQRLPGLRTTFGLGGAGTVVCAVSGKPPAGQLRGRVFMDSKPVYLVDVKVEGPVMALVGHSPAELPASSASIEIKLLGTNLDEQLVQSLAISLESASLTAKAAQVKLADAASLLVIFTGPLPAGEYTLVVRQGDGAAYTGTVKLTQESAAAPASAAPTGTEPEPAAVAQASPSAGGSAETPAQPEPAVAASAPPTARITAAAPLSIPAGAEPFRAACSGEGLSGQLVDRLSASLVVGDAAANLLFVGAKGDELAFVFGAPQGGWPPGQSATLSIADPAGQLEPFSASLSVAAAVAGEQPQPEAIPAAEGTPAAVEGSLREPAARTPPESSSSAVPQTQAGWEAASAYVTSGPGASTLSITFSAPQSTWDAALLKGTFSLLPKDPAVAQAFSNLALEGELAFRRSQAGMPVGEYVGNFPPGDLLVQVSYAGGAPEVSVLGLDAPAPAARLIPPAIDKLQADPDTGGVHPETLRWVVEFAPLVVKDASFLLPVCKPPANLAGMSQVTAAGTQATLTLDMAAWHGVHDWSNGLTLELQSKVALSWSAEPRTYLAVASAGLAPRASASIAQQAVPIDDKGFVITIVPATAGVPVASWSQVKLSSAMLLLDRNAPQFKAVATSGEVLGQPCIRLRFRRDAEALPAVAYSLLREALLAEQSIQLKLEWAELGCTAEGSVTFQAAESGGLDDLLKELGDGSAG